MLKLVSLGRLAGLLTLTFFAVAVHGYHLGSDDAAIYVPAIKRVADPALYPFGSEFFMSHAHLSVFPQLVGETSRIAHIQVDSAIFVWFVAGVFLLILGAWQLAGVCFWSRAAQWGAAGVMAAALTVPIAGTALVVMDPYLTARSLSAPATLLAVAAYAAGKSVRAAMWLLVTALVHPQMAMYGVVFLGCLMFLKSWKSQPAISPVYLSAFPVLPLLFDLDPATGPAREALLSRTFFLVTNWTWYEWIGVFAPLALCWWFSRENMPEASPSLRLLLRALPPFGLLFTVAGLALATSSRLDNLTRLQPMRAFHLVYLVFFAILGGALGQSVLRRATWRWVALFAPLAVLMFLIQREAYPASLHVEWPGAVDVNSWDTAFYWIRQHTPKNAVFAIDPDYMLRNGEDQHGFRAVAERSMLADAVKDSGAVSLFPDLAEHWKEQVDAQEGLEQFQPEQLEKLASLYPVTWIVTRQAPAGLTCPYRKEGISVCRIDRDLTASRRHAPPLAR